MNKWNNINGRLYVNGKMFVGLCTAEVFELQYLNLLKPVLIDCTDFYHKYFFTILDNKILLPPYSTSMNKVLSVSNNSLH